MTTEIDENCGKNNVSKYLFYLGTNLLSCMRMWGKVNTRDKVKIERKKITK